jgi:hypothetical protein
MRKVLVGVAAVLLAVVIILVGAFGVDFGTSIYAEYRLARSVRETAHLGFDPFVKRCGTTMTNSRSRPPRSTAR